MNNSKLENPRRRRLVAGAALAALGSSSIATGALAQQRLKSVTILVGSPAGGATDKLARLYAEELRPLLQTTVIVENRPGAGGSIAYEYVAKTAPHDGSVVFIAPSYGLVVSPHIVRDLPYDPMAAFVPVGIASRGGMTFAVGPGVPESVTTLGQFLEWAKAKPENRLYAAQNGSSQHLNGVVMARTTGIAFENVSYKGDAPAVQDLLGGHIPSAFLPTASAIPLQRTGKIRVLAINTSARLPALPDTPTFSELGLRDLESSDWIGVFASKAVPAAMVKTLNEAMVAAATSSNGKAALVNAGFEPPAATNATQFAGIVAGDYKRYGDLVEKVGFRQIFEKSAGK